MEFLSRSQVKATEMGIADGIHGGGALVDTGSGDVLVFTHPEHPPRDGTTAPRTVFRSSDQGKTWRKAEATFHKDAQGFVPSLHMMEHGTTLARGPHAGRLIRPARVYRTSPERYATAIFSDDGGRNWRAGQPFAEFGTGEAALVELSDGRLIGTARNSFFAEDEPPRHERVFAYSRDGGATWIWDRIPNIVKSAKLTDVKIHQVLDCSHALHHISLALAAYGLSDKERRPLYRQHRTLLRNGQWRRVVEELTELAKDDPENDKLATEINYLRKHGEAERLSYPHFRRLGLPIGSGSVESSIRRVINLRIKSNGMFWRQPHAEQMLQIRAQVISGQWDSRLRVMRQLHRRDGRVDWTWTPRSMSVKVEPENSTAV